MSDNKHFDVKMPSTKSVLAFMFLPQFRLSMPAFAHIGPIFIRTIAIMFVQAGLLRPNHPAMMYGLARNVPKFRFSDLIGEAWYNLRVGEGSTPYQYGIFIGVIMMICLTVSSAFLFILNLFVGSAQAQLFSHPVGDSMRMDPSTGGIFQVNPSNPDLAIDILNKVVRMAAYDAPGTSPLSAGLSGLMGVYNTALLVIASIVVFWAIISIVVDTARTGQIGGGRHSIVWVPIRFVFALALMIPLGSGFSGGQLITLKIAEWGSNLGTNGWVAYVDRVNDESLIANRPIPGDVAVNTVLGLARIETCRLTYNALNAQGTFVEALGNRLTQLGNPIEGGVADGIGDVIRSGDLDAFSGSKIYYRYQGFMSGLNDAPRRPLSWRSLGSLGFARSEVELYVGNDMVADFCGKITVQNPQYTGNIEALTGLKQTTVNAIETLKTAHYDAFFDVLPPAAERVGCGLSHEFNKIEDPVCESFDTAYGNNVMPRQDIIETAAREYYNRVREASEQAYTLLTSYITDPDFLNEMRAQGWGGMGVWYYKIQNMNLAIDAAMKPTAVVTRGSLQDHSKDSMLISLFKDKEENKVLSDTAKTMEKFDEWWNGEILKADADSLVGQQVANSFRGQAPQSTSSDGGEKWDYIINKTFKDFTMFDLGEDQRLYPLTELVSIGNMMLSIGVGGYIAVSGLSAVAGGTSILSLGLSNAVVAVLEGPVGDLVGTLLMIMLVGGMVLKYYVPLIPWIRVTFAILSWIVSVFEAVIIVPLLALANLSTEGEGLFTQTARNLWVSSLNILLRPILTVIGFVVALLIFNAMVGYVNYTFNQTLSLGGFSGGFYYYLSIIVNSAIYVFVVFTLANATFKTVDLLPNAVMRWMGGPQDNDFQDSSIEGFIMAAGQHTSRMAGGMSKGPRGSLKERNETEAEKRKGKLPGTNS